VINRSTTRDTPNDPMALCLVAPLFGTLVAETILASVHARAHRQAGHMGASDLIKTLQIQLARRGPSTYGSWTWSFATMNAGCGPTTHRLTSQPSSTWHTTCHGGPRVRIHSAFGGRSRDGTTSSSRASSPHDFFTRFAWAAIQKAAPPGMQVHLLFDQSVFVRQAIGSVLREGAIAAGLTVLMILLLLGSWRSTLVVMVSIPLSILTSIAVLSALGQTINTMTLGGLALAVGILVDDSTVTIENTHRLLESGHDFDRSVLEGAAGIAVPTLISTLAICCVFVSVFFLQYLLIPPVARLPRGGPR
jgi:hypothetical protein